MTEGFKFIADHPFVFVRCHIRICDTGNPKSRCAQGCVRELRKRRDVSSDDKLYRLAQGPLTISSNTKEMTTDRETTLDGKYERVHYNKYFHVWEKLHALHSNPLPPKINTQQLTECFSHQNTEEMCSPFCM